MDAAAAQSLIGRGVYSVPEVARLTKLSAQRIHRWCAASDDDGAFKPTYESDTGKRGLSFLDLIDIGVTGELREKGVPLQTLRRAYRNLQNKFGVEHAFCYRRLWTDGKTVFLEVLGDEGQEQLVDMERRQHVLSKVIKPFLQGVEYDKRDLASRWNIAKGLVIDPDLNYGAPTLKQTGHATYLIASLVVANGNDIAKVSDWYSITPDEIRRAIAFEESLVA